MSKAKVIEVKGKLLQKLLVELPGLMKTMPDGIDMPEELMEALRGIRDLENRREVLIGRLSDELVEKFEQHTRETDDLILQLEREADDWHREFDRKTETAQKAASRQHDILWAEAYKEVGIVKSEKRKFSISRSEGTISEVFIDGDDEEKEGNLFNFRPKTTPTTH